MTTYRCDISKSFMDANAMSGMFNPNECYKNSFLLMGAYAEDKTIRGVIGYILSKDLKRKVAVRHAWLTRKDKYTKEPQAIDVTVFIDGYSPLSVMTYEYLEVESFTPQEWLKKTEQNNNCPDLWDLKGEEEIVKQLKKEGYEVLQ